MTQPYPSDDLPVEHDDREVDRMLEEAHFQLDAEEWWGYDDEP